MRNVAFEIMNAVYLTILKYVDLKINFLYGNKYTFKSHK